MKMGKQDENQMYFYWITLGTFMMFNHAPEISS